MTYQTAGFKKMMSTYPITPNQLKAIHALLNAAGLKDEKESIVDSFSGGRTVHVGELSKGEAMALIGHLKSLDSTAQRADKMRNKILSMAHEMGWEKEVDNRQLAKGKKPIDMQRVNNWCVKYGYLHKRLDAYNYNELPRLVTQMEGVYKDHLK